MLFDVKCEMSRNNLIIGRLLGQGNFGKVYQVQAIGINNMISDTDIDIAADTDIAIVAVKTVKYRSSMKQLEALIDELKISSFEYC